MKILLAPAGSRGDVQPQLALAQALVARGHTVRVAGPPTFVDQAAALDLPYAVAAPDIALQISMLAANLDLGMRGEIAAFKSLVTDVIEQGIRDLPDHVSWADVVVGGGVQVVGRSLCEHQRKPYRYVLYSHSLIKSVAHPPPIIPVQTLPGWVNKLIWGLYAWGYGLTFKPPLAALRERLGLPYVASIWGYMFGDDDGIVAADPELHGSLPDRDLPSTGAWHLPAQGALDPDLAAWIEHGPKPLYLGFGSMPAPRPEETTALIVDAVARADCRLVLASGWARLGEAGDLPDSVRVIGPTPHALLLPRLAGAVHHGGAGTMAAAARCGLPQLIVPHFVDQYYHGHHVRLQGLGPVPLARRKLTAPRLAERFRALLDDVPQRERAQALGRVLQARDGLEAAVERVEAAEGSAPPKCSA